MRTERRAAGRLVTWTGLAALGLVTACAVGPEPARLAAASPALPAPALADPASTTVAATAARAPLPAGGAPAFVVEASRPRGALPVFMDDYFLGRGVGLDELAARAERGGQDAGPPADDAGGQDIGPPADDETDDATVETAEDEEEARRGPEDPPEHGYPTEGRLVGTPVDIEADLARGFPKPGSVIGAVLPDGYFDWKEQLYEKHGVKLAFNGTLVGQRATDTLANRWLGGAETNQGAAGFSAVLEAKWEMLNRGEDYQGGVAAALDWRGPLGEYSAPSEYSLDTGSAWPTDVTILDWNPWLAIFYWEQWFEQDTLVTRVGNQSVVQLFDFFRFKDGRSSFSNSEFYFPLASMPIPGPGFSTSFEWWPTDDSNFYVVGTVNDVNFEIEENLEWDTAFDEKQFFYGLEIGQHWGEFPTNFDHAHILFFYANRQSSLPSAIPNEAGGGVKLRGSKQWGRFVGSGSFTVNDAKGGPFGATVFKNSATASLNYLNPAEIRGDIGVGLNWGRPFRSFDTPLPNYQRLEDQYGLETYWKFLLTPDMWVTPGVQFIKDPAFNDGVNNLTVFTLKTHVFF